MVRAPSYPPGEKRRGKLNALLHPRQRRRVLEACERVIVTWRGPLGVEERTRFHRQSEVLLWRDHAVVRGAGGYFHASRAPDGVWDASYMMF